MRRNGWRGRARIDAIPALAMMASLIVGTPGTASGTAADYRPDAWIKLCGLSTGCVIDPPPHPWRGDGVYNRSGARQIVAVRMEDGEGVRFWITLQNDGTQGDTLIVDGCAGTRQFVINTVLVGFFTRPNWRPPNITKQFKSGTATFELPPASEGKKVGLTLNIVAPTTAEGVTYRCPISVRSQFAPSISDTVVAQMTTF
jgi:hypothetical protein